MREPLLLRFRCAFLPALVACWFTLDCKRSADLGCSFLPAERPTDTLPHCAFREPNGDIVVRLESLENAPFGDDGVAVVGIEGALFYVNAKGRTVPALPFENGADYFVEGVARTRVGGKIGFVDATLEVVISPQWDFAFPFHRGLAVVCNYCTARPVGEHAEIQGGLWGYIDRNGDVVVPVMFERDELPPVESVVETEVSPHSPEPR